MNNYRTLYTCGTSTQGTSATITANGVVVHAGPISGPNLFSFITSVTYNETVRVEILVNGSITIDSVRVTYPALINDTTYGFINFPQPIAEPIVIDNEIKKFPIKIDSVVSYDHLMFNGPNYWNVTASKTELYNGIMLILPQEEIKITSALWGYDHIKVDLNDIKSHCLRQELEK